MRFRISTVDGWAGLPKLFANHLMATNDKPVNISSFQHEGRIFKPSKEFSQKAHIKSLAQYRKLYNESVKSGRNLSRNGSSAAGSI
jgi:hypothetical protein